VLIPQDIDYPALKVDINREYASRLGLTSKEVVGNVITALTSNGMIAPSYWIDERTGNDYMLTVQYHENEVKNIEDLKSIPLRSPDRTNTTRLDAVCTLSHALSPTEVDHYQLRRVIDIYVATKGEDLGQVTGQIRRIIAKATMPDGVRISLRGMVEGMTTSFTSFGLGLILSVILVYLILVAQFRSFVDPFLILLAVPTGLTGVLIMLWATDTTLNIMSLMGVVMMVGIVVSNSILIVEFAHRLRATGLTAYDAIATSCRVRLRPVLMTSLATLIGLIPMAAKMGTGTEAYAPLARAIVGGLAVSVVLTMFIVPAAYLMVYRRHRAGAPVADPAGRIKEPQP
jgi:multidrug efflux pump subunit AcrB